MNKLTVYKQMTTAPADLFRVLKEEIGLKTTCGPFAAKAIPALRSLTDLTESEALNAANVFLGNLQTLNQGGIIAEDYDKMDFVKRGKTITISARVEAFLRAAARKGYRITEVIIPVPKEDASTTYFKENFYNGDIVYTLEDKRNQPDREITAERLVSGYFSKFLCRLEIFEIKSNARLLMTVCEMPNDEVLNISSVSEQGIYKSKWEKYIDVYGKERSRKVITDELNEGAFWVKWTGEMVKKTIIRRALKRVREVLPELKETIYAFDRGDDTDVTQPSEPEIMFEIPMDSTDVDMDNLTPEQKADVQETFELFKANPKLAQDKTDEIVSLLNNGASLQSVINTHYASIANIKKSKALYPIIQPHFEGAPAAPLSGDKDDYFLCEVCGREITSKKSIKYYQDNPDRPVRCYNCNTGGVK